MLKSKVKADFSFDHSGVKLHCKEPLVSDDHITEFKRSAQ